jgi:multiple sugar transport system ATP-binding protein
MAEIRFDMVRKSFGTSAVVEDLSLTIADGEFFTLVGPSGCGKSTILNMIAGLEAPTGGMIYFDDEPVNERSPRDRDAAMVFQSYALYPHMNVYENIAFPLKMKKERKDVIDGEVRRVAGLMGLDAFLGKKPKELSGGQRQRVALGRAIVRKPKVFLMDEPLSNLDARLRLEMRAELKKLHATLGITTVYVTHDQSEALGLSDRIAVVNRGVIQQCDTPREVYRDPANTFVAGFIGSPSMNLLDAEVTDGQTLRVRCLGKEVTPTVAHALNAPTVIAGIRPEDLSVTNRRTEGAAEATVSVVEPAGPFQWVDMTVGGTAVKGVAGPEEDLQPGSAVFLRFQPNKVHVFDTNTGQRL